MLSRVLLHVIETAGPINLAFDFALDYRLGKHVDDMILFINDVNHGVSTDQPDIMGLTSRSRIESRPIEYGTQTSLDNTGPKSGPVRVGVIETFSRAIQSRC